MIAVGIDVGKRMHEACFLDQAGREVGKGMRFANTAVGLDELRQRLPSLGEPVTIAQEANGQEWLDIHRRLVAQGYAGSVINPLPPDVFRNAGVPSGLRRTKADRRDARILSDPVRIGRPRPDDVPDDTLRQLRELTSFRWRLADQIGEVKWRLLTVRDPVFPEFADQFRDPFGATVRDVLDRATRATDFAALDLGELTDRIERASRKRLGLEKATVLHRCAQLEVRSLLAPITLLAQQVADLLATIPQPLTSIPRVGPVLAATILAECGDVARFASVSAMIPSAGLDPSADESGQFPGRRQYLSKRGSPDLR